MRRIDDEGNRKGGANPRCPDGDDSAIMLTVGANRIVPGVAIPHPVGNPEAGPEEDKKTRRKLVLRALKALQADISEQIIFES